jgi:ABC-type cobalamin/Fe3+-siderophores transport system ATPase subunit
MFEKLRIRNWRQFELVDITFHPRLTVLTGANGSGKTTILHLLNKHWGWNLQYVSARLDEAGVRKYRSGFWGENEEGNGEKRPKVSLPALRDHSVIGEVVYVAGKTAQLRVPESVREVFKVAIHEQQTVHGVFVPSHRQPYVFQAIDEIPTKLDAKEQIFQVYLSEVMAKYTGSSGNRKCLSPATQIKRSLISLATFGYGNKAVARDEDAVRIFEGFEEILRKMLPRSLGFEGIRIKMPDVLLDTTTGQFSFEAVSGGVASIIDMAWQIHMYAQLHDTFVVAIDEPETHLHPELQQRLMPDLLAAFPRAQFIITTHSPFMVTSVPDSNVYVLKYNEDRQVESSLLSIANKAGTADEILMEVLGVPSTMPRWATAKIEKLLEEFSRGPLTEEGMVRLREQMTGLGMGHLFPKVLAAVVEGRE